MVLLSLPASGNDAAVGQLVTKYIYIKVTHTQTHSNFRAVLFVI